VSTNIGTPVARPTVICLYDETYIAAPDLLAIAKRSQLGVSTVVRVLVAQERLAHSNGKLTPPAASWPPLSRLGGAS
jgi:hypothetical protein